jgi:protein O-mannosyl-transferase
MRGAARTLATPAVAAPVSVVLLGLLAAAPSVVNGFVYDDRPIVWANPRVHTLTGWWQAFGQAYWPPDWGDTNYRPLTILSFAVQWALGDGSPVVFHAVSVVLYLGVCLAVLGLARLVLPQAAAWLVAALFAVHPVHVEAVGNVVGQAELVVAICTTLAAAAYVRLRTADGRPTVSTVATIAALYAIACLSKETGFFLPGLLLAAECTVVAAQLDPARRAFAARARELLPLYGTCAAIAVAYLSARHAVLGGFGDDPNTVIAMLSHEARLLTMLAVVPEWGRLLLWPARLSADYSPAQVPIVLGLSPALIAPSLTVVGVVLLALAGWTGRRVGTFGLLWLAVALFPVSNVVLRSGVIIAERTLFLPSVGALLAVGAAAAWGRRRVAEIGLSPRRIAAIPVAAILAMGVVKSAARQRVWRTTDDFHRSIVEDAPRSYRAHYMHGMWHFEKGRRAEGERHVRTAIALFPYDAGPYADLADQYRESGLCAPARELYRRAIALGSRRERTRLGLVACLLRDAQFAEASQEARLGIAMGGPDAQQFRRMLAIADSAAGAGADVRQSGAAGRLRRQQGDAPP